MTLCHMTEFICEILLYFLLLYYNLYYTLLYIHILYIILENLFIIVSNFLMYGMYVRYMHTLVFMFKYNHLLMQRVQLCTSYGRHSTSWTQLQFITAAAGTAICVTHLHVCSSRSCVA